MKPVIRFLKGFFFAPLLVVVAYGSFFLLFCAATFLPFSSTVSAILATLAWIGLIAGSINLFIV
jgi:uncharacterized membrane protein (DUF2068 family)